MNVIRENERTPKRLSDLTDVIAQKSKLIQDFIVANKLNGPSFEAFDVPAPDWVPDDAPQEIKRARKELVQASSSLSDLVRGPKEGFAHLSAYRVGARLI